MDRIKTRIIIAVAERLSTAKDSNTKTELIEELSENLYQRYVVFVTEGANEEAEKYHEELKGGYIWGFYEDFYQGDIARILMYLYMHYSVCEKV